MGCRLSKAAVVDEAGTRSGDVEVPMRVSRHGFGAAKDTATSPRRAPMPTKVGGGASLGKSTARGADQDLSTGGSSGGDARLCTTTANESRMSGGEVGGGLARASRASRASHREASRLHGSARERPPEAPRGGTGPAAGVEATGRPSWEGADAAGDEGVEPGPGPVKRRESVTYEQQLRHLRSIQTGDGLLSRTWGSQHAVSLGGTLTTPLTSPRAVPLNLGSTRSLGSAGTPRDPSLGSLGPAGGEGGESASNSPLPSGRFEEGFRERTEIKWAKDTHGHLFFNEYIVLKSLGEGSYGKVKLCMMDMKAHRLVAVKMVSKDRRKRVRMAGASDLSATLRQEIAVMKALDHPHTAKVYEVIDAEDSAWMLMVMQHIEGGPVQYQHSDEREKLSEVTSRVYFRQLLQAVDYLHVNHVVHGDIKPDNLILSSSGCVKLIDFGSSIFTGKEDDVMLQCTLGTPAFMPPEACRGDPFSARGADLWACGVALYTLLCGRVPFQGKTVFATYNAIMDQELAFPEGTSLSEQAKSLLRGMLAKDPAARLSMEQVCNHDWVTGRGRLERMISARLLKPVEVSPEEVDSALSAYRPLVADGLTGVGFEEREYAPGSYLFREGEEGNEMFYIVEGNVDIVVGAGRRVSEASVDSLEDELEWEEAEVEVEDPQNPGIQRRMSVRRMVSKRGSLMAGRSRRETDFMRVVARRHQASIDPDMAPPSSLRGTEDAATLRQSASKRSLAADAEDPAGPDPLGAEDAVPARASTARKLSLANIAEEEEAEGEPRRGAGRWGPSTPPQLRRAASRHAGVAAATATAGLPGTSSPGLLRRPSRLSLGAESTRQSPGQVPWVRGGTGLAVPGGTASGALPHSSLRSSATAHDVPVSPPAGGVPLVAQAAETSANGGRAPAPARKKSLRSELNVESGQVYTEEDVVHAAEAARELEEPTGAGIVYKGDRELDRMLEATASMAASIGTVVLSSMNPQDALVARHGPGEFVGEMAVMSPGMVRTASGRARTCVRAVCIRREEMQRLFELRPDLQGQLKETIAARRATRELVAAYQALGQIHQDIEEEKLQRRVTAGREMVQSYYQSAAAKKVSTVMASRDAVFVPAMQKLLPGQSAQGIRRQVTAPVTRPGPLHQASLPQDVLCSDLTKASSLGPQFYVGVVYGDTTGEHAGGVPVDSPTLPRRRLFQEQASSSRTRRTDASADEPARTAGATHSSPSLSPHDPMRQPPSSTMGQDRAIDMERRNAGVRVLGPTAVTELQPSKPGRLTPLKPPLQRQPSGAGVSASQAAGSRAPALELPPALGRVGSTVPVKDRDAPAVGPGLALAHARPPLSRQTSRGATLDNGDHQVLATMGSWITGEDGSLALPAMLVGGSSTILPDGTSEIQTAAGERIRLPSVSSYLRSARNARASRVTSQDGASLPDSSSVTSAAQQGGQRTGAAPGGRPGPKASSSGRDLPLSGGGEGEDGGRSAGLPSSQARRVRSWSRV